METVHRKAFYLEECITSPGRVSSSHTSVGQPEKPFKYRRRMKSVRSWIRFRPVVPALIGVSLGFALSMLYIPIVEQQCLYDLEESQAYIMRGRKLDQTVGENHGSVRSKKSDIVQHATVAPKLSHFNDGLRPFYVASELGKRDKLLVGVLTSEDRLDSLVLAINNTWAPDLPRIIFFIPYSRDAEFHEKYTKVLGIPIVQLDVDSEEDTALKLKLSFKMLKYMHDHFINNYEWFLRAEDDVYVRTEKLMEFVNSVNSSKASYIGRPIPAIFSSSEQRFKDKREGNLYEQERYCFGKTGVILSRTTLLGLAPNLEGCVEDALSEEDDKELGRCLYKKLRVQCTWSYEATDMFYEIPKDKRTNVLGLIKDRQVLHAITLYPMNDPMVIYHIHRYYTELELNRTFVETRMLQTAIKDMLPQLPEGVPEKHPSWPIGFQQPFRPTSRFEVIQWEYFNENTSYGSTEIKPQVQLEGAFKKDAVEVIHTAVKMLTHDNSQKTAHLINGYRRVDPRRGAEYILDMRLQSSNGEEDERHRVHMLRPFIKVESIQMTSTTEQRGIHLVLPVLKGEVIKLEEFLKMYQKVCLQTGENVVLLTVFVNIRDDSEDGKVQDKFSEGKALIARYKQKYTWAQFPWIQIGVQFNSLTLLMDIVTMKLPTNALIFLTSLNTEFSIGFLNRCRVNALNGQQVFFPIPFAYYNPDIVYRTVKVRDEIRLSKDAGHWDTDIYSLVCFNNKDYKDNRIHSEDFLKETEFHVKDFMEVFVNSNLKIFRAVDVDLKRKYEEKSCNLNVQSRSACLESKAEAMASRSQLALLLFDKEREEAKSHND